MEKLTTPAEYRYSLVLRERAAQEELINSVTDIKFWKEVVAQAVGSWEFSRLNNYETFKIEKDLNDLIQVLFKARQIGNEFEVLQIFDPHWFSNESALEYVKYLSDQILSYLLHGRIFRSETRELKTMLDLFAALQILLKSANQIKSAS
jgi:hypothetical protein